MQLGIALSGGGLRGAAHIGFMQVLTSNKIKADVITGTSAGSIVAGMYALNISPSVMQKEIKKFSLLSFRDLNICSFLKYLLQGTAALFSPYKASGPLGIIRGNVLANQLKQLYGNAHLKDITMPFAAISTDLHTGEMVVFASPNTPQDLFKNSILYTSAYLHEAVRASISIPGIFEPYYFDGRYLVDGGLKANVPANICRRLGAEKVIAVDLGFQVHEEQPLRSVFEVLMQTIDIMGQEISDLVNEYYTDLLIKPSLPPNVTLTNFDEIPACISAGQRAALNALNDIKSLVAKS